MSKPTEQDALKPTQHVHESHCAVESVNLKKSMTFDSGTFSPELDTESVQQSKYPQPKKKKRIGIRLLMVLLLGAILAECFLFVHGLIASPTTVGLLWLAVLVVGVISLLGFTIREWQALRRLKLRNLSQQQAHSMFSSTAIGNAKQHCHQIADGLDESYRQGVQDWSHSIDPNHTDKEVMVLFEKQVLVNCDRQALTIISRHASAAGAMIAVSPFAVLDMLLVLWRNIKMLDQVAESYGMQLSYWSRIHLLKSIFKIALVAGASEILTDAGGYLLGAGTAGKLSSRVAQGLGASVLTARLGLKALAEVRPMPFLVEKKPTVATVTKQVMADLKALM